MLGAEEEALLMISTGMVERGLSSRFSSVSDVNLMNCDGRNSRLFPVSHISFREVKFPIPVKRISRTLQTSSSYRGLCNAYRS